jgi:hypothetical protein
MTIRTSLGVAALCWLAVIAQAQSITVTSPNGGENWTVNTPRTITWISSGLAAGQTVDVVLRLNGVRLGDIAVGIPAATGSLAWTVGAYQGGQATPGPGYQVRVRNANAILDDSNGPFTIAAPATSSLDLLAPNGGEGWATGSTQMIRWNAANLLGNVKVELLRTNLVFGTIADSVPATANGYAWKTGQYSGGQAPLGGTYAIRITSLSQPLSDTSQAFFSIVLGNIGGVLKPDKIPTIQLPDLVICLRQHQDLHVPGSGSVKAKVKNIGQATSPATRVSIHFEGDGTNHRDVPPLSPGGIFTVHRHEYYSTIAHKHVTVMVDDDHKVVESNENNNSAEGTLHRTDDAFDLQTPFLCSDGTTLPIE